MGIKAGQMYLNNKKLLKKKYVNLKLMEFKNYLEKVAYKNISKADSN